MFVSGSRAAMVFLISMVNIDILWLFMIIYDGLVYLWSWFYKNNKCSVGPTEND